MIQDDLIEMEREIHALKYAHKISGASVVASTYKFTASFNDSSPTVKTYAITYASGTSAILTEATAMTENWEYNPQASFFEPHGNVQLVRIRSAGETQVWFTSTRKILSVDEYSNYCVIGGTIPCILY